MQILRSRPARFAAVAAAATVGVLAIALATAGGDRDAVSAAPAAAPGTPERFAALSRASSNQCGLQATGIDRMARGGRLQGSCCSRMDYHRYREQVEGLRRYAHVPEIPSDPYDISVPLAKRLLAYQHSIRLTSRQKRIYDRAMKLSDEGGPCCCRCWRWSTFEGQAKYLITRRRFTANQVAAVWTLEDGCGGAGHAKDHGTS